MKDFQKDRVIMYFEIKKMLREKFSIAQISRELVLSRKTIYFYKNMSEEQFWEWVSKIHQKTHKLSAYEDPIHKRLERYPDLSGYQIHDWLLEHYPNVEVSRRTVSNFVAYLRQKYNLPKPPKSSRDFSPVPELPYGQQAQVDFGEYKMTQSDGRTIKVYFMATVLSRCRYKHVVFRSTPFTSMAVVEAHEQAFAYLGGIPEQIVCDQDKLMIVSENRGDILFTKVFQAYIRQRKFQIYLCRKADPQTKGKIESVVKYVKSNFLKNRPFVNIEVLNAQALAWLERTANGQKHGTTQKVPAHEMINERPYLKPFKKLNWSVLPYHIYHLRKDNSVNYKGNFYTVPKGIYKGKGTQVWVKIEGQDILICNGQKEIITRHALCFEKGKVISKTDHFREKSQKIKVFKDEIAQQFTDPALALENFTELQRSKGRYIRDQLQLIRKVLREYASDIADQALAFCYANSIYSANDFKAVVEKLAARDPEQAPLSPDLLLKDIDRRIYNIQPQKSNIDDYESIINPQ
jgi:transposase